MKIKLNDIRTTILPKNMIYMIIFSSILLSCSTMNEITSKKVDSKIIIDGNDEDWSSLSYFPDDKIIIGENFIELHSENPYYQVFTFKGREMKKVSIIGKVIEIRRQL